jgi:hypothetical protein
MLTVSSTHAGNDNSWLAYGKTVLPWDVAEVQIVDWWTVTILFRNETDREPCA